jgi:hypothetical protein
MPLPRYSVHPLIPVSRQQTLVTDLLGLGSVTWVPLVGGETSAVFRVPEHRLVFRFSHAPSHVDVLAAQVRRSSLLVAAGVPFVFPAINEPVVFTDEEADGAPGGAVTVWHDLGNGTQVDYEEFGRTLRSLHDDGTPPLADDPDLRVVADFDHMRLRLDHVVGRGLLSSAEHDVLAGWIPRMEDRYAQHATTDEMVLVHDDVWAKNVIMNQHGAHLLDPDNLAWGTRDHDLAFLAFAHDAGYIEYVDLVRFESGYGQLAPTPDVAWTHKYVHRMRWVLDLAESRHLSEPARMLAVELPLWCLPRGPRDHF